MLSVCPALASDELPAATPGDTLYRSSGEKLYRSTLPGLPIGPGKRLGGTYTEAERVRLPDPMTPDEMAAALEIEGGRQQLEDRRKTAADGRKKLFRWLPFVFVSIFVSFVLKSYGLQMVGVGGFIWSISQVLSGIIEIKLAENWAVATWVIVGAAVVLVVGFGVLAFVLKDKGLGKPGVIGAWFSKLAAKVKKKNGVK